MHRIIMLIAAGLLVACEGPEGAAGPAGPEGAKGEPGEAGQPGQDGADGADGADGEDGVSSTDYAFRTDDPSLYAQTDRLGMPAVNTALIASKDAYNEAAPADDVAGTYVKEISASLVFLHDNLDDDLATLSFAPCDPATTCLDQGGPLILPDTLKLDITDDPGWSTAGANGRMPADPVVDVTLAVVLLDYSTPGLCGLQPCRLTTLVGVLNPDENDKPFLSSFPYLAAPHQ